MSETTPQFEQCLGLHCSGSGRQQRHANPGECIPPVAVAAFGAALGTTGSIHTANVGAPTKRLQRQCLRPHAADLTPHWRAAGLLRHAPKQWPQPRPWLGHGYNCSPRRCVGLGLWQRLNARLARGWRWLSARYPSQARGWSIECHSGGNGAAWALAGRRAGWCGWGW